MAHYVASVLAAPLPFAGPSCSRRRASRSRTRFFRTAFAATGPGAEAKVAKAVEMAKLALSIALLGVMIQLVVLGHLPLISLALAFSFGFYGLIRKKLNLPAVSGLALETLIILPFALGYLAWQQAQGALAFSNLSLETDLLLVLGGVVTSLPLLFFASAVTRLSLTTVGIFQYLAPSLTLLLAVFYFEEPFNSVQFATFFCVWVSIVIFTTESLGYHRKQYRDHARATDKAP